MWFARTADGFRGWFAVESLGTLVGGIPSSHFTASIVSAQDTAVTAPIVTASTQVSGVYYFDVSSSFLTTHGAGQYFTVVEINSETVATVMSALLHASTDGFDSLSGSLWAATSSIGAAGSMGELQRRLDVDVSSRLVSGSVTLASASQDSLVNAVWDEPNGEHVLTGSTGHSVYLGSVTNVSASVSVDNVAIAAAVWDRSLGQHMTSGSAGWTLDHSSVSCTAANDAIRGTWVINTTTKTLTIYARDGVTVLDTYELFDAAGSPSSQNVFERRRITP